MDNLRLKLPPGDHSPRRHCAAPFLLHRIALPASTASHEPRVDVHHTGERFVVHVQNNVYIG